MAKTFNLKIINLPGKYFVNGKWYLIINCENQEFAKYWLNIYYLSEILKH